ncbi:MAG: TatD family hydrolase [Flavobacteriaceae bacterium]|jgi:TatD DNase family protein|nr:TatD family hydrolase [Flavobacteriaceae bacterium]
MKLIDTHTHLYSEEFDEDRNAVIGRALQAGVERFYLPAIDSSYYQRMKKLKSEYPENIFLMIGLHPCDVKPETYEQELAFVRQKLDEETFAAIGEIGIDLYWDTSTLEIQQKAFRQQIRWAKEYNLPINIHIRSAFDEVFEILEEEKSLELYGIFHCFSGTLAQAEHAVSLGFSLGIGGVVTFKNGKIDQFLKEISLQHIVLETDSPYLAPVPHRGKRNEPAYIPLIAEKLSDIYEILPEEIVRITTENARRIYKL